MTEPADSLPAAYRAALMAVVRDYAQRTTGRYVADEDSWAQLVRDLAQLGGAHAWSLQRATPPEEHAQAVREEALMAGLLRDATFFVARREQLVPGDRVERLPREETLVVSVSPEAARRHAGHGGATGSLTVYQVTFDWDSALVRQDGLHVGYAHVVGQPWRPQPRPAPHLL